MGKQILFLLFICSISIVQAEENRVIVGAERTAEYYPLLEGKRVAVFSNLRESARLHWGVPSQRLCAVNMYVSL